MPPGDVAPVLITMLLTVTAGIAAVLIFRGPVGRAIARRIEGTPAPDPALSAQLAELEHRLAEMEQERSRVAELEERVDFAERLLARGRPEPARLERGAP
jgi:hypothetical protein